jgi:hypothetical protein
VRRSALSKKLSGAAQEIYDDLRRYFMADFDDAGSIRQALPPPGRNRNAFLRYRGLTTVGAIRRRPTTVSPCATGTPWIQVRVPISELMGYIESRIAF